jgi:hypothetical protein
MIDWVSVELGFLHGLLGLLNLYEIKATFDLQWMCDSVIPVIEAPSLSEFLIIRNMTIIIMVSSSSSSSLRLRAIITLLPKSGHQYLPFITTYIPGISCKHIAFSTAAASTGLSMPSVWAAFKKVANPLPLSCICIKVIASARHGSALRFVQRYPNLLP